MYRIRMDAGPLEKVCKSFCHRWGIADDEDKTLDRIAKQVLKELHNDVCTDIWFKKVPYKDLRKLVYLLRHWAEVQHDSPDISTPSEEWCDQTADELAEVLYNHFVILDFDFAPDDVTIVIKACKQKLESHLYSAQEKEDYAQLMKQLMEDNG